MNEIYYVYPKYKNVSFSIISKAHIARLKPRITVQEIDEEVLDNCMWIQPRNVILHPVLYATIGDRADMFKGRQKRLQSLLKIRGRLGGFETSDSNKISRVAVNVCNRMDVLFLPTNYAINVYKKSGVRKPLHKVPHGISDIMCTPSKTIVHDEIARLRRFKRKKDAIFILYFCTHSEFRKGADLMYEAMQFIQGMHKNVYLVLKSGAGNEPYIRKLQMLRTMQITSWLAEDDLRQLYDVCDMLVVPSRGGGFELNALEGIARGLPTLVPKAGCFLDYINYTVPMPILKEPLVFPDNPIHIGTGWECTPDRISEAMHKVISNLNDYKQVAEGHALTVRKEYNWDNIVNKLYELLREYKFCD